jgi:hypothetical protein
MLTKSKPEEAKKLFAMAQTDADRRFKFYQYLAGRDLKPAAAPAPVSPKPQASIDQQP